MDIRKLFPGTFQDFNFNILEKSIFLENVGNVDYKHTYVYRFQVSQPCASVSELPAALRRPQKKHALEFWSMYLVDVVDFCQFFMILGSFIENWTSFTEKCVKFTKLSSKISFCVFAHGSP